MANKNYKNIFIQGAIPPDFIAKSIKQHNSKTNIGAHSIFLGQIREDEIDTSKVTAIEYTCYQEMANKHMHEIREDIFAKYPLSCMHVYHSLGKIKTGELCFFVFTSSAHRTQAMAACEEVVNRIKKELPIWGKELFEEENYQWKKNT